MQVIVDIESWSQVMQGILMNEVGVQVGEIIFWKVWELVKQSSGDDIIKDVIVEKFQVFVVWCIEIVVCQCGIEKSLVRKMVIKCLGNGQCGYVLLFSGCIFIVDQQIDILEKRNMFFVGKFDDDFVIVF